MSNFRKEVLKQFRNLHKIRLDVFKGDGRALSEARKEINSNFKKNKDISDEKEIQNLIKLAKDVQLELKTNVVQAVETEPGIFEAKVKKEILLDNVLFKEDAILEKRTGPKCSEKRK